MTHNEEHLTTHGIVDDGHSCCGIFVEWGFYGVVPCGRSRIVAGVAPPLLLGMCIVSISPYGISLSEIMIDDRKDDMTCDMPMMLFVKRMRDLQG